MRHRLGRGLATATKRGPSHRACSDDDRRAARHRQCAEERLAAGGAVRAHRVCAGDTVRFGRRHVHAISNLGTRPATSVHVYSPPLRSMAFYDGDGSGDLVAQRTMSAGTDWAGHGSVRAAGRGTLADCSRWTRRSKVRRLARGLRPWRGPSPSSPASILTSPTSA